MKTGIAVALHADKVINDNDCATRILKIIQQLQEQIKNQEADFQSRLKQVIEARQKPIGEQFGVEQEGAISEALSETRSEVARLESRLDEIERTLADPANQVGSEIDLNGDRRQ